MAYGNKETHLHKLGIIDRLVRQVIVTRINFRLAVEFGTGFIWWKQTFIKG